MKYFYILNNVYSKRNDLPVGPRIKSQNIFDVYPKYDDGDGPYASLKELRKNSSIFKKLLRTDPRRAQKICEKKFIIHIIEQVPFADSTQKNLGNAAIEMLSHTISGKIKDKKAYGGHLFNSTSQKIIEVTKQPNPKGVWEARISIKDITTGGWIEKESPTTFFPKTWSKGMLLLKLEFAFLNKEKESETRYNGKTDCGIPIVFIYRNNEVVSVYPLYE